MWTVSAIGGTVRELRQNIALAIPSFDGSQIAFRPKDRPDEIWLAGASGENPRKIAGVENGYSRLDVQWAPDGRTLGYIKRATGPVSGPRSAASAEPVNAAIEIRRIADGETAVILSDPRLQRFCWARDGRIYYSRRETAPNDQSVNIWELRTDVVSGKPLGPPRRVTNWLGYTFDGVPTISADGSRLAFSRGQWSSDIWWGALDTNGTRLTDVRRLTLDERYDWPGGWTRDGGTVLFYSDRNGRFELFRQDLHARAAEPIPAGSGETRAPQVSPDGAWVLYLSWPQLSPEDALEYVEAAGQGNNPRNVARTGRLMRLPISGGAPETVFDVTGHPGRPRLEAPSVSAGLPAFRCAHVPGMSCVLIERQKNEAVFTAFDPVHGRTGEIARLDLAPADSIIWDLSPDGSTIVAGTAGNAGGARMRFLSLRGADARVMTVKGFLRANSVAWAADGQSLFATAHSVKGGSLLHVNPSGDAQVLRTSSKWVDRPIASPDGRHLLFADSNAPNNLWVLENFR
jgi:Tol biopolymer transport system component